MPTDLSSHSPTGLGEGLLGKGKIKLLDRFTSRREEGKEPDKLLNESHRGAPNFSYPHLEPFSPGKSEKAVPSPPMLKKGNPVSFSGSTTRCRQSFSPNIDWNQEHLKTKRLYLSDSINAGVHINAKSWLSQLLFLVNIKCNLFIIHT